jgi:hypothetical protein
LAVLAPSPSHLDAGEQLGRRERIASGDQLRRVQLQFHKQPGQNAQTNVPNQGHMYVIVDGYYTGLINQVETITLWLPDGSHLDRLQLASPHPFEGAIPARVRILVRHYNRLKGLLMGYGDVWILGAGSSVEVEVEGASRPGAPLVQDFRQSASNLRSALEGDERDAFDTVLTFWKEYGRSLNIEQLFGYVDSPALMGATRLGRPEEFPTDIRKKTHYLIAKVITERLGHQISSLHSKYVEHFAKRGSDTITFNWDITIDRAMIQEQARVDYGFPDHWGRQSGSPNTLLKLHGSLNWKFCRECNRV